KLTPSEVEAARRSVPFRQFSAWLEVFNTGDRERIGQFLMTDFPSRNLDEEMRFRARTSGFEYRAIEQASTTAVTGLVQARDADRFARFVVEVEPAEPHRITRLGLQIVPRPAEFALPRMSEAEVVTTLRKKVEKDAAADRFAGTVLVARIENGRATEL